MTHSDSTNRKFRGLATGAAVASLFAYAVVLFITPASNNQIKQFYGASLGLLGWLPVALMTGFIVAVLPSGRYSDRHGKLPAVTAGCAAMAAGTLLFTRAGTFEVAAAAMFLMGIGGGLSEGNAMALIADLYHNSKRTAMVNLSQAVFSVGAVASPLAIGWLLKVGLDWRLGYVAAGVVCALSGVVAFSAVAMRQERPHGAHEEHVRWRAMLRDRMVICLALGIMLYVGAEIGQSNWMSVYLKRGLGADDALAAASPSSLWVGIGVGRVAAAWASKHLSDMAIIRWSLFIATAFQGLLLLVKTPLPGLAAGFGLGLGLGPVFPTIVSIAGAAYPRQSGTVLSIIVAAGAAGGAVFPLAVGWIADYQGMRAALWLCFAILALNLGMFLRLRVSGGTRWSSGPG